MKENLILNEKIEDYDYELSPNRIAAHPLDDRSASKLLVVDLAHNGHVGHKTFKDLPALLPPGSLIVLNDTKVIYARLPAVKPTGGAAEILLIDPVWPHADPHYALKATGDTGSQWNALIGGKNIKEGDVLTVDATDHSVKAEVLTKNGSEAKVRLTWTAPHDLSTLLNMHGRVPLPPYIKRPDDSTDRSRYQTVFAEKEGSVAAPTASLHFTKDVLRELYRGGSRFCRITLHVGAGTFKPVDAALAKDHHMHAERVEVTRDAVASLLFQITQEKPIIAVGTTAFRTLESLYWWGCQAHSTAIVRDAATGLPTLDQWCWLAQAEKDTGRSPVISTEQALKALLYWIDAQGLVHISGQTKLMVVPGYEPKIVNGLVTNFHQPRSTLLLLVAAFIGKEHWKSAYTQALNNDYRFLSYGDSSLLLRGLSSQKN